MSERGPRRFNACCWLLAAMAMLLGPGCGVPGPVEPPGTYRLDFHMPADARVKGAIVFVIDGVNASIFDQMLAAGELPSFKKYFVDRGLYVPHAIASTPTVTLPNLTSIVTGRFPGHHNITGVNWFDRNQLIWRDYSTIAQKNTLDGDYIRPTMFEQMNDELTFSLFFQPHRGATKFFENWTTAGPSFFFEWYEFVDRLTLSRYDQVMDIARQENRFPALTVIYLLAPDSLAYKHGASSGQYHEALVHSDRQIGRVLADVERAGLLDKIYIALTADHGHWDVQHHLPMDQYLKEQVGLKLNRGHWWESDPFEDREEDYRDVTAVPYGGGDRYWALCLRRPLWRDEKFAGWDSWIVRPSAADIVRYPTHTTVDAKNVKYVDLPANFCGLDAVDAVAYAVGVNRVRIVRRSGEVEFRQDDGPGRDITYHPIRGDDPLGWRGAVSPEALAGAPMSSRAWLNATAATKYPDLPAQILAYFRAQRAGDVLIFAADGWDFGQKNKSGHGGIGRSDMYVPLGLAGPGVPHRTLNTARTVDLAPTLLQLLGKPLPTGMDGQSLVTESD